MTAKLTAILRDTPLSRTINQDTENERNVASGHGRPIGATGEGVSAKQKNLLSYVRNDSPLMRFLPDTHMRPLACHLHAVALVVGGIHQDQHLPSWLEGEQVVQHPAVTGVDLLRLGMLKVELSPW